MKTAAFARWIARLLATAVTGLFITFLVYEGVPDPRELSDAELAGFGMIVLLVLGTLIGWRRDLPGAAFLLVGYGGFAWAERGWPPWPFAAFLIAAVLLLISATIRWVNRRRSGAPPQPAPAAAPAPPPTAGGA